jgi:hypothetical protein
MIWSIYNIQNDFKKQVKTSEQNKIPKRAGTTDKSISTGIKYWVCCIEEPCLISNLSIIYLIKTKVKRQIKTVLFMSRPA